MKTVHEIGSTGYAASARRFVLRYWKRFIGSHVSRGFTLIETFVAITILLTAVVGPLSIASEGLYAALLAADQTTALFLAQDGLEYIHSIRDTNDLNQGNWLASLDNCISADANNPKYCYLDSTQLHPSTSNIVQCSGSCPALSYNSTSGFYNYAASSQTNTATVFTRTISILTPVGSNPDEAAVSVVVGWPSGSITHTFTVREDLFKWQ